MNNLSIDRALKLKDDIVSKMREKGAKSWFDHSIDQAFEGCVISATLIGAAKLLARHGLVDRQDLARCQHGLAEFFVGKRDYTETDTCSARPVVKRRDFQLCEEHCKHPYVKGYKYNWLPGYEYLAPKRPDNKRAQGVTEEQIRQALFPTLIDGDIVEEVEVCGYSRKRTGRLDVAHFTDDLHGYEIKSDQDTLSRLPGQIESFGYVCQTLTVIVGPRYEDEVRELLPEWVGLTVASGNPIELSQARKPQTNPNRSIAELCDILWRRDVIKCLRRIGLKAPHRGSKDWLTAQFAEAACPSKAPAIILEVLRSSQKWSMWKEAGRV